MNKKIRELTDKMAAYWAELGSRKDAIEKEKRERTPEEIEWANAQMDKIEVLQKEIAVEERAAKMEADLRQPVNDPVTPTNQPVNNSEKRFSSLGEQLIAVVRASHPEIRQFDPRLVRESLREQRGASGISGMGETVPSEGGFAVQQDFSTELFKRTYETGILPSRCRRIPISSNANGLKLNAVDETSRANGSRWGGIRAYWVDEGDSVTASKPKLRKISLNLNKLMGICYATEELLSDAAALEAVIMQGFAEEFGFKFDDAIINGTGAGQPLGIMNSGCLVSITKETGQVATTFVAENAEKMYARLWRKQNAAWLINADVWPQLFQLKHAIGTGGVPVFMPPGGLVGVPYGTLFNLPILELEQCQTLGTAGDVILADLSQYILIDKGSMRADTSVHVLFLYDEMTFRFIVRIDGQPAWDSALTPYKGTGNTRSPFVVVADRS